MPLSDKAIKAIKPADKVKRYSDEKGLYLEVAPSGGKLWRLKYRYGGKEKRLSFGAYPDTSLKRARERRDEARELLAAGIDPGQARKEAKEERAAAVAADAATFEAVAREWFERHRDGWADSHSGKIIARLENDLFPWLGQRQIAEITAPDVLACLRRIEARGALDTAHRAGQNASQVFRYAIATGRAERDPVPDLRGALPPARGKNFAAVTDPAAAAALLRALDAFQGTFVVQCALRLSPLVFVRPGELRKARWADIDLEREEWRYIASKTKAEHTVPLARQALAILAELRPLTGDRGHVFPGARDHNKPMSSAAVNAALRRMGFDTKTEITGHGFRAMARTLLAEELHMPPEIIEHQLAHKVPDALGTAYNRTKFIRQRKEMMQRWADYLDRLKAGDEVIHLAR